MTVLHHIPLPRWLATRLPSPEAASGPEPGSFRLPWDRYSAGNCPPHGGVADQITEHPGCRFPVIVLSMIRPGVLHSSRSLPRFIQHLLGISVVVHLEEISASVFLPEQPVAATASKMNNTMQFFFIIILKSLGAKIQKILNSEIHKTFCCKDEMNH